MKILVILSLSALTAIGVHAQQPGKKDPPKLIKVTKSPPVVVPPKTVKKVTPKKYRNKPVPMVVMEKFVPAKGKQ